MTHREPDELTRGERDRLDALPRELPAPSALRGRVVRSLAAAGLVRRAPPRWTSWAWAAALVLMTLSGFAMGRMTAGGAAPAGPHYLLLLYDGPGFDPGARSEADLVAEYSAWAGRLAVEERLVAAEKLGDAERVVGGPAAGPVSGFFLVAARDLAEAEALARGSPHAAYGGTIVVRPVDE